ncbi:response regulator [soil metagenome]
MTTRPSPSREATLLLVDDQPVNIELLKTILGDLGGYENLHSTTDARRAAALFCEVRPDLVLLDLHMPHLDGFAVLDQLQTLVRDDDYLPVLVLTADTNPAARRRALASGASDFLNKPFDADEVLLRINNLLKTRALHLKVRRHNQVLEKKVRERTRELEASQLEVLERLAWAAEYRDDDTGEHTYRVGQAAATMATELRLPPAQTEILRRAARLHDVGKIGIPDSILLKPGRLSAEEFETIKSHTTIGAALLAGGRSDFLKVAEEIALNHHERWDGSGYPRGLAGEAIPLTGRIVAVIDVYDALTHARPYKSAWSRADALAEIKAQSGKQFDPAVVDAFLHSGWGADVSD